MKITTINISKKTLEILDNLVKNGVYKSRSQAVRDCLQKCLPIMLEKQKEIELDEFNDTNENKVRIPINGSKVEYNEYKILKRLE